MKELERTLVHGGVIAGLKWWNHPGSSQKRQILAAHTIADKRAKEQFLTHLSALGELFKQADVVAVLQVLSGDTENYATTVYKGDQQPQIAVNRL
jgi:hypothetical protein